MGETERAKWKTLSLYIYMSNYAKSLYIKTFELKLPSINECSLALKKCRSLLLVNKYPSKLLMCVDTEKHLSRYPPLKPPVADGRMRKDKIHF